MAAAQALSKQCTKSRQHLRLVSLVSQTWAQVQLFVTGQWHQAMFPETCRGALQLQSSANWHRLLWVSHLELYLLYPKSAVEGILGHMEEF